MFFRKQNVSTGTAVVALDLRLLQYCSCVVLPFDNVWLHTQLCAWVKTLCTWWQCAGNQSALSIGCSDYWFLRVVSNLNISVQNDGLVTLYFTGP